MVWSPCCPKDSQESFPTPQFKSINSWCLAFFTVQRSHSHMATGKTVGLTRWDFVSKVMSLLFNMLSRFVIIFLPRSKCLLISWLQSASTVILEPKKMKFDTVSTFLHLFAMRWQDCMPWSSFFECWILSQLFHTSLSPSRGSLVPLQLSAIKVVSSAYPRLLVFLLAIFIPAYELSSPYFVWCTLHIS